MIAFILASFFLLITPGPGVLSAAGIGSAYGFRAGLAYVAGLFTGNNLVGLALISGLAAALELYPGIRLVLAVVSTAYLLYLAAKIAFAGSKIAFIHSERAPGFWNGLTLQAINPKAYVVNAAIYSGFPFWPNDLLWETIAKLLIFNAIWLPVHFAWLGTGVMLHRLNLAPPVQRAVNIAMALSMLAVVGLAAAAQFG